MVTAELLVQRQAELWNEYESLLKMGKAGLGSPEEEQILRRLGWWDTAEREHRLRNPDTKCIHGLNATCDKALVCCWYCAFTGIWVSGDTPLRKET
jgi:hypothetical protein